ncbi:MAG: S41 family peptidase [Firmicutes bacterium]|nr:S41 family peptidase [Bacillota bacterium]
MLSAKLKKPAVAAILFIAVFILAGLVNSGNLNFLPVKPAYATGFDLNGDDSDKDDISEIKNVIDLLQDEYIKDLDQTRLLNGAMDGLKSFLKLKKKDISGIQNNIRADKTDEANWRAFGVEYSKLLMKYGGEFKNRELEFAALRGMTEVIQKSNDDPYTVAMDPKEYRVLQEQLNSRGFSGVGVFIEQDKKNNNKLMIVEPIEGTPAYESGIKPGDYILRINGVSTRGMSIDNASSRIRGPEGSTVVLTLERKGLKQPLDIKVKRSSIVVSSLKAEMMGNIGYIKLRFFGDTTRNEFEEALSKLEDKGAKGLIIDLRNNGGGYINAAVQVCNPFLKAGTVVTSVVNYRKGTKDHYKSWGSDHNQLPLVILVNKYSASASEITAGCIQDLGVGVLVGTKTFGKGSVQTIHQVAGGGAVKFTTAHYLTPKGKDINKIGIVPDIKVDMDPVLMGTKNDKQLQRAVSYLKDKIAKQ